MAENNGRPHLVHTARGQIALAERLSLNRGGTVYDALQAMGESSILEHEHDIFREKSDVSEEEGCISGYEGDISGHEANAHDDTDSSESIAGSSWVPTPRMYPTAFVGELPAPPGNGEANGIGSPGSITLASWAPTPGRCESAFVGEFLAPWGDGQNSGTNTESGSDETSGSSSSGWGHALKRPRFINLHRYLTRPDEFLSKRTFSDSDADSSTGSNNSQSSFVEVSLRDADPADQPLSEAGRAKLERLRRRVEIWFNRVHRLPRDASLMTSSTGSLFNDSSEEDPEAKVTAMPPEDESETESEEQFKSKLLTRITQMMFVSGETAEPSIETTSTIEEITRQQVVEILTRSTHLATRRGARSISTDDLIFLIRHDKAKVSRLRTFLSWKDVRKNVKDSDDKGGADAAEFAAADDAAGVVAGPQDVASKPKNKRAKVGLAWDVNSFFSVQIPEREDEEDEEEEEQNYATLQRLAAADERTKNMTKEEYVFWSECRQASFTYRKSKRFREWAGFGIVTESKPNDDIVDILGFLTFEIVQTLTEEALKVKEREDHEKNRGGADASGENAKKRKRETGLFDPPEEGRTPIEPRHILEAYRKLQATPQKAVAMLLHNGRVPSRLPIRLI